MRTLIAAGTIAVSLAFVSVAGAQPVGLGTSPQGTMTYAVGAAVAKTLTAEGGIQARVQPSSGTGAMIPLVNDGEIDLGFCNTLELYDAYHGVGTFQGRKNPNLRTLAVIFPIKVGLFVRADSPIKTVADMKGHTMAYGFTSQEIIKRIADAMLATAGLSINDLKPVMVPNLVRGVDAFVNGRADITTFALGSAKVSEADAAVHGIRYISLANTPEALKGLKSQFRTAYIGQAKPSPRYAGVKEPVNIMQFDYTIFTSTKLPADRARKITEIIAANKKALGASHPLFKSLDPKRMYSDIDVPYADGAKAYYKDKGIQEAK
jgi:TRAP transporter TAXI family solute receptor